MAIPIWAYIGVGSALAGVAGGWVVRDWKSDADAAAVQLAVIEAQEKRREAQDEQGAAFEGVRAGLDSTSSTTRTIIRESFREIPVPTECAAPVAVGDGLRDSVSATNRAVTGEPSPTVPDTP